MFLGLFAETYPSYNINVRHFTFHQCIVYIVSNIRALHFSIFFFYYLKKYILFLSKSVFLKLGSTIQKIEVSFDKTVIPEDHEINLTV